MAEYLLIEVFLHNARYHGAGEAEPSPARLFQALVAGAGGGPLVEEDRQALCLLERLDPPLICLPRFYPGQHFHFFGLNNDADALGGDLNQISKIRIEKHVAPRLFRPDLPLLFIWKLKEAGSGHSRVQNVLKLAARLYQLGRGIDMAWARASVLGEAEKVSVTQSYEGRILNPVLKGSDGFSLPCPMIGSLESLERRFAAGPQQFRPHGTTRLYARPPRAKFASVDYAAPTVRYLFELRRSEGEFATWPCAQIVSLAELVRNAAAQHLASKLPEEAAIILRTIVGQKERPPAAIAACSRTRIVPLPSIGHPHADGHIRRVLIEIPATCLLRPSDVRWAVSGLSLEGPDGGACQLVATSELSMLSHYGVGSPESTGHCVWRTVTPIAVPVLARDRSGPRQTGGERAQGLKHTASAIGQALRHAGIRAAPSSMTLRREPFAAKGEPVDAFAHGIRFDRSRLWHAEIRFLDPVQGPLAIGDGRFLGLGLMAPVRTRAGIYCFQVVDGLTDGAAYGGIARALRRATMARVQSLLAPRARLPKYFSGHEETGVPDQSDHQHLYFAYEPGASILAIIAPHILQMREPDAQERRHLCQLENALAGFVELRAGPAGHLRLQPLAAEGTPLVSASQSWGSATPYQVSRHARRGDAADAIRYDVENACRRRGSPPAAVRVLSIRSVPGEPLSATLRLTFTAAVDGPLLLGRNRHLGGGLFLPIN